MSVLSVEINTFCRNFIGGLNILFSYRFQIPRRLHVKSPQALRLTFFQSFDWVIASRSNNGRKVPENWRTDYLTLLLFLIVLLHEKQKRMFNIEVIECSSVTNSRVLQTFINKIISSEHEYFTRQDVFAAYVWNDNFYTLNEPNTFRNLIYWVSTELLRAYGHR